MSKETFQIAIDGPVAAGKGTVSKKLAERLDFLYVDTGATYRMATLLAVRNRFDFGELSRHEQEDVLALKKLVEQTEIDLRQPKEGERDGRLITAVLNGEDVSWAIRDEGISSKVAIVAKIPEIREALVRKQRLIAEKNNVVMEGRDITYRVLPNAQLKIYLDAREDVRVQRRIEQLHRQGQTVDAASVAEELHKRDELDMSRKTDPLKIVSEAWHFDASDLSIDQTVDEIIARLNEIRK